MGCRLSYSIDASVNAEESLLALDANVSSSFSVPKNVALNAEIHQNATQFYDARFRYVFLEATISSSLNAEYSQSIFEVCGRNITSANPTTITVDNTNISSDNIFLFIDTNNPS